MLQYLAERKKSFLRKSEKRPQEHYLLEDQGSHEPNLRVDPAHYHREHRYVDIAFLKRFVGSKSMPEKRKGG